MLPRFPGSRLLRLHKRRDTFLQVSLPVTREPRTRSLESLHAITFLRLAQVFAKAGSSTYPTSIPIVLWLLSMNPLPIATFRGDLLLASDSSLEHQAIRRTGIRLLEL